MSHLSWFCLFLIIGSAYALGKEQPSSRTQMVMSGNALFLLGTFDDHTATQVIAKLKQHPDIQVLVLTVNGGSINDEETLRLGRYIRANGLDTHLVENGVAASGGVSLLLAGNNRSIGGGAHVGVHAWAQCRSRENICLSATDFPESDDAHALHRDYTQQMLGNDDFYWFSIHAVSHDSIHWLSEDELARFDIVNTEAYTPPELPFADAFNKEYKDVCHNCP